MSSSSCDEPAAQRLLRDAFDLMRAEAPAHHEALCPRVAALGVNVEIAPRSLAPHVVEGRLVVGDPLDAPRVTVRTTLAATLALLEARCTLVEAVARGQLDVRGDADALDAAADAFALFLHGLVRAPSSPRLLEALRREAAAAGAPA